MQFYSLDRNLHKIPMEPNVPAVIEMPYSEVCMHLKVAEKQIPVVIVGTEGRYMARLLRDNWKDLEDTFTLDITLGEAGIHRMVS